MTKMTHNNDMNYRDLSNQVRYVMKTKHDNDMTDCTSEVYAKK